MERTLGSAKVGSTVTVIKIEGTGLISVGSWTWESRREAGFI